MENGVISILIAIIIVLLNGVEVSCICDNNMNLMVSNDGEVATNYRKELGKVVFLTFDDGPTKHNTREVLKVLNKNNIRGSFFVIGKNIEGNSELIRELDGYGMAIYPHSQCHIYNKIYMSEEEYFDDLEKCANEINMALGRVEPRTFVRMPGGSKNGIGKGKGNVVSNIKNSIKQKGMSYIDWNVSSGDAVSTKVSSANILKNIKFNGNQYRMSVVLMHDAYGKDATVEALQNIIDYYKEEGYQFKTLKEMTRNEYKYLVKCKVINGT